MSAEFRLHIKTGNSAFDPDPAPELARLLRAAADAVERDPGAVHWFQDLRDCNGNKVGQYALKPADYWPAR